MEKLTKYRQLVISPHPRRVGLKLQSPPSWAKNIESAKAGFVGVAAPFEGVGNAGKHPILTP